MLLRQPALKGSGRQRLVAAATTTALVAGVGGLVLAGAPAANAANVNLNRNFAYNCNLAQAGASVPLLEDLNVGVRAQVTVPSTVSRNQTIPARMTTITLSLPEILRSTTTGLLGGKNVSGSSQNARVGISAPGAASFSVLIQNLAAAKQAIPDSSPWTIRTVGNVPAIKVPARAHTRATLSMPAAFNINATIYRADDSTQLVTMACTAKGSRTLGAIAINKNASKIAAATVSPKKIKAKKTKAKIAVKVAAGSPAATGNITAKLGKKVVGKASVRGGKATIKLAKFKKKGTYKIKLTYSGSVYAKAATKTVKVKVKQ